MSAKPAFVIMIDFKALFYTTFPGIIIHENFHTFNQPALRVVISCLKPRFFS
jgi:predicted metalloprotease with PDZ domain